MASACSLAPGVSLPLHQPPLPSPPIAKFPFQYSSPSISPIVLCVLCFDCRLRHRTARMGANYRAVAAARTVSLGAARRMLGSAMCGVEAVVAVPPLCSCAYELQLASQRYFDARTDGEFGGGYPVEAGNTFP
ncbi:uncharacterized protein LOC119324511 [Triticum dicoccoides]|uniref:uncharacterized protein LOC119324511 n=1 Tax=Triticum dicoccoides TaxID=85692 RepID=UPI001891147C|nr:uncharacterized protein LOC119324511 [Triticum dicoccoides]